MIQKNLNNLINLTLKPETVCYTDKNVRQYRQSSRELFRNTDVFMVFGCSVPTFSPFSKYSEETLTAGDHWTCEFQCNQTLWKNVEPSRNISKRETVVWFWDSYYFQFLFFLGALLFISSHSGAKCECLGKVCWNSAGQSVWRSQLCLSLS